MFGSLPMSETSINVIKSLLALVMLIYYKITSQNVLHQDGANLEKFLKNTHF